jgi:quinol-cytochrome oxidoreductase complex cytochrome b subunit
MKIQSKKGIQLGQAFGAVLALVLVAVLVIIAIYLFTTLGSSFEKGSAATNATGTMVTQFAAYPALVGLVGTIIFLALVIGVLVTAFAFGGKKGV